MFSSGIVVAPHLTEIRVGVGNKQWKGDLNTTIQQLFIEKVHNLFFSIYGCNYFMHFEIKM
jgi:hypothetical protein